MSMNALERTGELTGKPDQSANIKDSFVPESANSMHTTRTTRKPQLFESCSAHAFNDQCHVFALAAQAMQAHKVGVRWEGSPLPGLPKKQPHVPKLSFIFRGLKHAGDQLA